MGTFSFSCFHPFYLSQVRSICRRRGRECCHRARPSGRDGRQELDKIVCRHSLYRLNASMFEQKKKKKVYAMQFRSANGIAFCHSARSPSGFWYTLTGLRENPADVCSHNRPVQRITSLRATRWRYSRYFFVLNRNCSKSGSTKLPCHNKPALPSDIS